jgi:hypothetical protein
MSFLSDNLDSSSISHESQESNSSKSYSNYNDDSISSNSNKSNYTQNERKKYKNSKLCFIRFFDSVEENNFLYNFIDNKFYEVNSIEKSKYKIYCKEIQYKNSNKKEQNEKEKESSFSNDSINENNNNNKNINFPEEKNKIFRKSKKSTKKKRQIQKPKKTKENNNKIVITKKNYHNFTFFHEIIIDYIHYSNKTFSFKFLVNLNNNYDDLFSELLVTYGIPDDCLECIYKNNNMNKLSEPLKFSPKTFNFSERLLFIEKKNNKIENCDFSSGIVNEVFPKTFCPHLLIANKNYKLETIRIASNFNFLNIDIYEFPSLELRKLSLSLKLKKGQEFLSTEWKDSKNLLCSINSSISKNKPYSTKEFEIIQEIYLREGVSYVFNLNVNTGKTNYIKKKAIRNNLMSIIAENNKIFFQNLGLIQVSDFIFGKK